MGCPSIALVGANQGGLKVWSNVPAPNSQYHIIGDAAQFGFVLHEKSYRVVRVVRCILYHSPASKAIKTTPTF